MALRAVVDHPKFARLKTVLRLNKSCTLGYLEALWHFCGRYTPQGNIGKYSNEDIEAWLEWDGEPGELISAFIKARWIDTHDTHRLVVHDWHHHADDATRKALNRSKRGFVSLCRDTVEKLSPEYPPPSPPPGAGAGAVPEPEPVSVPGAESVPVGATPLNDPKIALTRSMGWDETVEAAIRAGMVIDPSTDSPFFKNEWAPRPTSDKANCVRGIYAAIDEGVFGPTADPKYVPSFRNYWIDSRWNEVRPRNRGQPSGRSRAEELNRKGIERAVKEAQERQEKDAEARREIHRG